MTTSADAREYVSTLRQSVDHELASLIERTTPAPLYESVQYALEGKGKRIRPILTLLSAELHGCPLEKALPSALSMEVFHTFTLVHDDIMDRSDLRRGRATVHVRWDEPTAILCGDYLMGLAVQLLSRNEHPRIHDILALHFDTIQSLCEGQVMDMMFEAADHVSVDDYMEMIDRKTAALLQSCLETGGLLGEASPEELATLRDIGLHMGRAFQVQDDLLDLTAADDQWGKAVGRDLTSGKRTYLLLKALESAEGKDKEFFATVLRERGLAAEHIEEAREKMRLYGVLESAETTVIFHSERAVKLVESLRDGSSRDVLIHLLQSMQYRVH